MPTDIFLSYSSKDGKYRTELSDHLAVLRSHHGIHAWTDQTIRGGEAWRRAIDTALAEARIVVLLVSAHALTSDFILDDEVGAAMAQKRHIYPILVRDCAWAQVEWLQSRQMRPVPLRPLNKMRPADRDSAYAAITDEIAGLLRQAA